MDKPAEKRPFAWQPLTLRGVAAFATAKTGRLWLVQLIFAIIGGLAVGWCLRNTWVPVITSAVKELPEHAEVRRATLNWEGDLPRRLTDNQFLSIAIDLKHEGTVRSPAHLQVELGEKTLQVLSLLGFVEVRYPEGWRINLGRTEAQPWWGAWTLPLLWIAGAATIFFLLIIWSLLSSVYFLPAWLVAFFSNRQVSVGGAWRVCGAALMPGALLFMGSIVLYGLGFLDLPQLAFLAALHIAVGWIYLAIALFFLPERPEEFKQGENPFAAARAAREAGGNPFGKQIANDNPFTANAHDQAPPG